MPNRSSSLRDLLTQNLGLKLMALVLALAVQIVVQRDSVRDADVNVRLRLFGVPPGQICVGALPENARLRVRGRRVALAEMANARNLEIGLDLSSYRDGDRLVFEPRHFEQQLPVRAVEVVTVEPAAIDVRLQPLQTKILPVEVALTGEAAAGWRANPKLAILEPATVQVTGPASQLAKMTAMRTQPVDLAYAEKDVVATARLAMPSERLLTVKPDEVKVTIKLEETDLSRTLPGVPVVMKNCPEGAQCSIDPPEVNLRVEGMVRPVRALLAKVPDGLAYVDLANAVPGGERQLKIQVQTMRGLVLSPTPAVAKFAIVRDAAPPAGP